ncbi:hypothetical protein A4G99_23300 [Haladaptatus sp. R4]|uniref:winged helix-turn-helix domain-containing protein n=1 Tax=Haladaptatus sp. R4 TaxID=1679489 RepID=UPI0007B46C21|nr:helix-turn-helix domain-containing protein [Haladaptatus sp. R4]KZN26095.1 hypothetical protein A4G99_23300 [Haladaptatus sp. R4]
MSDPFIHEAEPHEVFTSLSDGTRLTILQTLWEGDDSGMTFSELRTAAGERESSGFNYHLGKLVGRFVTKEEAEGTYRLTQAGKHVCGAIASGIYTARGTLDPVELNDQCETSGDRLRIEYESETIRIGCDSCSSCPSGWNVPAPPSVFSGYDHDAIPAVVDRYIRTISRNAINGFCPYCNGRMQPTVRPSEPTSTSRRQRPNPKIPAIPVANRWSRSSVNDAVPMPDLRSTTPFCSQIRPSLISTANTESSSESVPVWRFSEFSPERVTVVNRTPLRVDVTFRVDTSSLTVHVDETFGVSSSDGC